MPFAASTDLIARFGETELVQLTNPTDPTATSIGAVRMDDAIADIDALVTAKLAARYAMPLTSVPRVLCNIACDLVRARLYEDRITERVADREKAALALLNDISAGKLSLGLDGAQQPTVAVDGPAFTTAGRVFTRDSLADY